MSAASWLVASMTMVSGEYGYWGFWIVGTGDWGGKRLNTDEIPGYEVHNSRVDGERRAGGYVWNNWWVHQMTPGAACGGLIAQTNQASFVSAGTTLW